MHCPRCGLGQPSDHVHAEDRPESMLRVSRNLDQFDIETEDGSVQVPAHHVRFSFWLEDRAVCALSIPDDEAEALSVFLVAAVADGEAQETPSAPPG
jgi:hypothetical protein